MPFHVVWELRVRSGREAELERRYGADGDWARLFRRGEGYVGTALTEDERCLGEFEPV